MVALNICLKFSQQTTQKIIKLNQQIPKNMIIFGKQTIPHLTILQFYASYENIHIIKEQIEHIKMEFTTGNITNQSISQYEKKYIFMIYV